MSSDSPRSPEEAIEFFMSARARGEKIDPTTFAAEHAHLGSDLHEALAALNALDRAASESGSDHFAIASHIGPYRIVREIGRGGMGVVLEAVEEPLGRRVALKVLPAELLASSSARARFRREAELAARLDHSGIATVYGAGVEDARPWIAMRFVDGITLSRAIVAAREAGVSCVRVSTTAKSARETALAVAACLAKVAHALHAAHEQGVVHRDVKPSNIMLSADGAPTLVDFGLAIPEDSEGHTLTRTGDNAGTPAYMAPEILAGERTRSDAQCDVYSLGVTLYECLALRRPFDAPTPFALHRAILAGEPTELRVVHNAVPRDLAIVVATAMERDPKRRYRSAAGLAADLEACVRGDPIQARPLAFHGRILRWARRDPKQALLSSMLFAATIFAALAVGSWWSSRSEVRAAEKMSVIEKFQHLLQRGFISLSVNWIEEADQDFVDVLALNPYEPEAIAGRAIIAMKQGHPERVPEITRSADSPAFKTLRAIAAGLEPDTNHGPEWYATAPPVEMFVDGWRLVREMEAAPEHEKPALAQLAFERYDEAIRRSRMLRMYYHVQRAVAAAESQNERSIRAAAASLLVLWPEDARSNYTAGVALAKIAPHEGLPLLKKAAFLDPNWIPVHRALGKLWVQLGRHDLAASEFETVAGLKASDVESCVNLALAQLELGCTAEAREAHAEAIARSPNASSAWTKLAHLASRLADEAAEESAWRAAVTIDPNDVEARMGLALFLIDRRRDSEAQAHCAAVVALTPDDANAWGSLASVALSNGAHAEALAAAEAGLALSGTSADLLACRDRARAALATSK